VTAVIVKVAPLFVQTLVLPLLYATGRAELAVAATVNVELNAAPAGACVVTVIVWLPLLITKEPLAEPW
jgi:hypothetical protein